MKRIFLYLKNFFQDSYVRNCIILAAVCVFVGNEIFSEFLLALSWKGYFVLIPFLILMLSIFWENIDLFISDLRPKSLNLFIFFIVLFVFAATMKSHSYYAGVSTILFRGGGSILFFNAAKFPIFFIWMNMESYWRYLLWPLDFIILCVRTLSKRYAGWMLAVMQLLLLTIIHQDASVTHDFGEWMNSIFGLQPL